MEELRVQLPDSFKDKIDTFTGELSSTGLLDPAGLFVSLVVAAVGKALKIVVDGFDGFWDV